MTKTVFDSKSEILSYFKIDKGWYGENKLITVKFKNGTYTDRLFVYKHDEVYQHTIYHYEKLDCWKNYGCFMNSYNIPSIAKKFVKEIINK